MNADTLCSQRGIARRVADTKGRGKVERKALAVSADGERRTTDHKKIEKT